MKKIGIIIASLILVVIMLSSCATQHKCDAYSSRHRDKVDNMRY